jgi:cobyrinic acid a,c-diamide synthase
MSVPRIMVAGTHSGVGKTTLTIGLMSALKQQGYRVQGFKCGPDYIDPSYHTAVTGRPSRNLDSWMLSENVLRAVFERGRQRADVSVIEGVMGLYDGRDPRTDTGSSAHISRLLNCPVLLIVDCAAMARSAAAVVKGFQALHPEVNITGVIANRLGSAGHGDIIRTAVEQECGIPVVGCVPKDDRWHLPARHLGLIPVLERGEMDDFLDALGRFTAEHVDMEQVWQAAQVPSNRNKSLSVQTTAGSTSAQLFPSLLSPQRVRCSGVRLAVARDAAFHFYYPENIELLQDRGVEIVSFSPLAGDPLPAGVHGLYIGGGFPEEFAAQLAARQRLKQSLRKAIHNGMPTLAECGGFIFLTESIQTTDWAVYPMIGLIPGKIQMQKRLAAIGYREVTGTAQNVILPPDEKARGHEFHYSTYDPGETGSGENGLPAAYVRQTRSVSGRDNKRGKEATVQTTVQTTVREGVAYKRLVAGYTHFHFASCPSMVDNWIQLCEAYKEEQGKRNA